MESSWLSTQRLPLSFDQSSSPIVTVDPWQSPSLLPNIGQSMRRSSSGTTIAFIDSTLADYQTLVAGVAPGTAVYLLDPVQDAIAQITQTLLGQSGITGVHLVSHGSMGGLQLGNTILNASSLDRYSQQIQSWSQALTDDADILLYGCDVGAGTLGAAFLQQFAQITGADLAASSDTTGGAAMGGDWELEVNTGEIAQLLVFQPSVLTNYQHILPTELVSVSSSEVGAGDNSSNDRNGPREGLMQTVSEDGRYVVFTSSATDLGFTDTNGGQLDVFVRDRQTGETILVSTRAGNPNTTSNSGSYNPVISANGRYVAFVSSATDLIPGGTSAFRDNIYVRDLQTNTTTLVSRAFGSSDIANEPSLTPSISDDGSRIAFSSGASNLVSAAIDVNAFVRDVFVWDRSTNAITLASVDQSGVSSSTGTSSEAYTPYISGNGNRVVFVSRALLATEDASTNQDVYVRDLVSNQTILVTKRADGLGQGNGNSIRPTISDDGRYVAFISQAGNLTPVTTFDRSAFVRDLQTGITSLMSVQPDGVTPAFGGESWWAMISGNGRHVAFTSTASNLVSGSDTNNGTDVFVRNLDTNTTAIVSISTSGTSGNGQSVGDLNNPQFSISDDGRYVAFSSDASNLVSNDTNGLQDVFVRDVQLGVTTLISRGTSGSSGNGISTTPILSGNGQIVAFSSTATDLVTGDTNGRRDVFAYFSNLPPVATNDSFGTNEDTPLSNSVLTNDSDSDGNTPLTVSLVSGTSNGSLSLNANGTFNYTPNTNTNGTDTFTYSVRDSLGASSGLASVVLSVTAVNDAPTVVNDAYTINNTAVLNVPPAGVLANDADIDTSLASVNASMITSTSNGVLVFNPNGSFTYTPNAGFTGLDSFTYRANDGSLDSNLATVSISVTANPNASPIAVNDSFGTNEDTPLSNSVLTNDSDPDGNTPLTVSLVSGTTQGSLSLNANGTFNYTPDTNANGTDTFTYSVRDSLGASSGLASVVLSVTAVNDAPVATNDAYTIASGSVLNVGGAGVTSNDTDVDTPLGNLSASTVSSTSNGVLTFNANGSFTYTQIAGFVGIDSFTYRLNDGSLDSTLATVSISVTTSSNLAPTATSDTASGNEDTVITGNVITNDSDPDGNTPLTATVATNPSFGALSLNPNGSFSYTPNPNTSGTDSFTYIARDALGATSNPATVVLTVNSVNDAPTFTIGANQTTIAGSGAQTVNGWATGFVPGPANEAGQTIAGYTIVSNSDPSIFAAAPTVNSSGTLVYTPATSVASARTAVIGVAVRDNGGTANGGVDTSATQFFTVTVNPQPTLSIAGVSQNEGNSGNTPYQFTVSLSSASSQTVSVTYSTADGTAGTADNDYVAATGTLVFLPGETRKTISVNVVGDTKFESGENFTVNLSAPSNAQVADSNATGTILNEDSQPSINISGATKREGNAGNSNLLLTVSLSGATTQTVSVNYATADGTATVADGDYFFANGTVVFAPGETSKTIAVTVNGDRKVEQNETFSLNLSNPVNGNLATSAGIGTIANDDSVTTSDFNGDGIDDIVWRNYTTGENQVWLMGGTLPTSTIALLPVSTNWILEGVVDFNGDSNPDLLWRDYNTGSNAIWLMSGGSATAFVALPSISSNWYIEGVGDFNGDTKTDILWRESSSGYICTWFMNGVNYSSSAFLAYLDNSWTLDSVSDINNDGQVDLIWRYTATGYTAAWLMYGSAGALFYNAAALPSPAAPGWDIVKGADYNQDGKTDLVWRNRTNGTNYIWLMDGTRSIAQIPTSSLSPDWYGVL